MYNQASSSDQTGPSLDPLILVQQMREDGLAMKRSALSTQQHMRFSHNQVSYLIRCSVCLYYAHISFCQNIFEVASSPGSDINLCVLNRNLVYSIFNIDSKAKLSYGTSHSTHRTSLS
jgi:hypothetical protein